MPATPRYWLLKTEPESFSIDDLAASPGQTTCWDGVRNYQARNFIRDEMHVGDRVLFYHSSAEPAAIVGTATVVREAYPDPTAWDPGDHHYDPKASPENPTWQMVDIRFERKFAAPLALPQLRKVAALKKMELLRKGSRLSVQPVRGEEFEAVLRLADEAEAGIPYVGAPKEGAKHARHKMAPPKRVAHRLGPVKKHAVKKQAVKKQAVKKHGRTTKR